MKKYNTNLFGQKLNVSQAIDSNAEGKGTITRNIGENANGTFNVSNTGSEDSKKTIHSIGIGTKDSDRSNALEIMQNGDIYLYGVGGYEGDNASDSKSIQSVIQDSQSGGDYTLPIASADTLGGIKVGEGLNIDGEGVLSSTGSGVGKVDSQQDIEGLIVYGEIFNVLEGSVKNIASGLGSHAEGLQTQALGQGSHSEGSFNISSGNYSHSEGSGTKAVGNASHAEGYHTNTSNEYEHACGKYNYSDSSSDYDSYKTIYSVGIGTSDDDRKNAFEISKTGNVYVKGIGGYIGKEKEGKQTLQDTITDIKNNGYSVTSLDVTNEKEYNVLLLEPSSDKINSSSSFKCVDLCFNPNTINDWKHGLFLKERSTGYYSKIGKDSVEIYGKTEDQPHVISIRRSNTDIEYSSSELGNTDVLIQNEGLKIGKYVTGSGYEPSSDNSNSILKKSRLDIQNLTTGGSSNTSTYISSQLYADDNGNVDKSAKIEIQGETSNIDLHGTTDSYIKINNKYVITGAEDEKRIKIWTGTQDQYDQIEAKDENTLYFITA